MAISGSARSGRGRQNQQQRFDSSTITWWWRRRRRLSSPRIFRCFLICLAFVALVPPLFFHFKLRRFHQMQLRKCSWINDPPLVCAHGGDSTNAFPNTMTAYTDALRSQVDCIEIDISRSSDGELFAIHDRDLQRISGNYSSRVGHLSTKEIKELNAFTQSTVKFQDQNIPTMEEALMFISSSVRRVILDIKVWPPLFEKGLAKDVLSIVARTNCQNCVIWSKNDNLVRDVIRQLANEMLVGYIVMVDPSTGVRNNILRMKGAGVVGIYHPLIDEKLVRTLHGRNKEIYAWTVDDRESMERMLFEQVDAVVTSEPSQLQSVMDEIRTDCLEDGFSLTQ